MLARSHVEFVFVLVHYAKTKAPVERNSWMIFITAKEIVQLCSLADSISARMTCVPMPFRYIDGAM